MRHFLYRQQTRVGPALASPLHLRFLTQETPNALSCHGLIPASLTSPPKSLSTPARQVQSPFSNRTQLLPSPVPFLALSSPALASLGCLGKFQHSLMTLPPPSPTSSTPPPAAPALRVIHFQGPRGGQRATAANLCALSPRSECEPRESRTTWPLESWNPCHGKKTLRLPQLRRRQRP